MRNIFDQYDQPENKLTHALVCTLDRDRALLAAFLRWLGLAGIPPARGLGIVEQHVPGSQQLHADEGDARGLPDAFVFDANGWGVVFESKVQGKVRTGQIRRHQATAARYGFEQTQAVAISVSRPLVRLPDRTLAVTWREVYQWFSHRSARHPWAKSLVEYMRVFETKMGAKDYDIPGTITVFDGLRFDDDNPYTYREGKRLIRLLGDELQARKDLHAIGVDPKGKRRPAITGKGTSQVWDYIPLKVARDAKQFTEYPHLTMSLKRSSAIAAVTVPNGVRGGLKTKLTGAGLDGFRTLVSEIEKALRPLAERSRGAKPLMYVTQRHYANQRSAAEVDARLEADLRTAVPRRKAGVKYQPEWIEAIYHILVCKRSNLQLGVEMNFQYKCPVVRSPQALDLFAQSWIALSPFVAFVLGDD